MGFGNRARLLWSYLLKRERVSALPVEYIVETTARCNLRCPMCPREVHTQPNEDMADDTFETLVKGAVGTGEHMMLVGLGEPLMDRKIFDRIEYCSIHGISTLLSTNGTLLDQGMAERVLRSSLDHITLSFDGASKETYEHYRKGARFERVRDNFVGFARTKHKKRAKIQIVVQMIRMFGTVREVSEFRRFWSAVEGVDLLRVKEDEVDLLRRDGAGENLKSRPCHYLWRGAMYVKHDGRVYPCCQSYALGGSPAGDLNIQGLPEIFNSGEMRRLRKMHAEGRAREIDMCGRCQAAVPHPMLAAGSLLLHGKYVRRLLPIVERLMYRMKLLGKLRAPAQEELVQIQGRKLRMTVGSSRDRAPAADSVTKL